jgi:acyl-CoA hydrolase
VVVTVDVEDLESDSEPIQALSAYFTMVALDRNGRPRAVKPLVPETEEEKILYETVKKRRDALKTNCASN